MDLYSIQELFAGRAFRIPAYQRAYSWGQQQWQDLLDDLEYLPDGRDHFTGMIVIEPTSDALMDREGTGHQWVEVVDGQQRLTTLVVFLEALRRVAPPELGEGIRKRYISAVDVAGQSHTKLRLAGQTAEYLERCVLSETPAPRGPETAAEIRLRDAMAFFRTYLAEIRDEDPALFPERLVGLHSKLTQRLKVMLYPVASDAEVGVMFEVMNNRGRRLSELDLVKNYVLYLGTKLDLPEEQGQRFLESEVAEAWAKLLTSLMDAGLSSTADEDRLLRASWLMAYDPNRRNWERSRSVKDRFSLRAYSGRDAELLTALRTYVQLLADCAGLFADIYRPTRPGSFSGLTSDHQTRKQIVRASDRLHRLGVLGVFLPLLLATRLRMPGDAGLYLQVLGVCERFAFRVYRLRGLRADTGESSLVSLAHKVYTGHFDAGEIPLEVAKILGWYSTDAQFRQAFVVTEPESDWYGWGGLKYLLYEYEQRLLGEDPPEVSWEEIQKMDRERTIEHILPQTPSDPYWQERFDEEALRLWTHDLGNLALSKDNSSYSNKPFPKKRDSGSGKPCYAYSPMRNEREIAREWTDWTVDSITARRERLVAFALERWNVDIPVDSDEAGVPDDVEADLGLSEDVPHDATP